MPRVKYLNRNLSWHRKAVVHKLKINSDFKITCRTASPFNIPLGTKNQRSNLMPVLGVNNTRFDQLELQIVPHIFTS